MLTVEEKNFLERYKSCLLYTSFYANFLGTNHIKFCISDKDHFLWVQFLSLIHI